MPAAGREIEFIDEKERELFARFELGEQVREFLQSSVGRYVHGRAKQQLEQAREDALAVEVDGWRGWLIAKRRLRRIRQQAEVARSFMKWMADAIVDGNQAATELAEYRKE